MKEASRRALLIGGAALGAFGVAGGVSMLLGGDTAQAAVANGAQAPNFSAPDANGQTRSLQEFRGRTVVLEWTNHGCPYVRKHYDSRNMQTLQQEATANGVVWLQIISSAPGEQGHLDGAGARARVQTDGAHPTATLLDPSGTIGRTYGAATTPHMYVINPQGVLVYQGAIDDRPSARPSSLEGANNYVRAALADLAAGRAVTTAQTTPYGCNVKYAG
ncbi:MAG TPA: thioredoxin family protein [Vitreimonas sp.]|uniref:thioredoxin family protein n=1 Tax=Vitreimonas sp. TaxID=3069702 RepID=UPI002D675D06|nr:thioredoxin family protein [Vitreimonas sp.]HYD86503.1 thioredoxin family protein [Vitreimonas sp.]